MGLLVGTSWSNLPEPFEAAQEAATLAMSRLGDEQCDLALVFASPGYSRPELFEGVRVVTGRTSLLGFTHAGFISEEGQSDSAVAVMLIRCEGLELRPGAGDRIVENPTAAGSAMAAQALEGRLGNGSGPGRLFLTFVDASQGTADAVLDGVRSVLGEAFPIVGAATATEDPEQEVHQFCLSYQFKDSAVGFLLGGPMRFGVASRHGWEVISRARRVTRATGPTLYEIDGRPAYELYRAYLPQLDAGARSPQQTRPLSRYPLGFGTVEGGESLLRIPFKVGEQGNISFNGCVPDSEEVRLMMAGREGVLNSAREAAQQAVARLQGAPLRGVLVFSSYARRRILGREAALEIAQIREVCGEAIPILACYTHGEIAPYEGQDLGTPSSDERVPARYRNNAIVVLALGEE